MAGLNMGSALGPDVSIGRAPPPTMPADTGTSAPAPGAGAPAPSIEDHADDPTRIPDSDAGQEATPEEQAQYEAFVKAGYALIYRNGPHGGEVNPDILKMLDNDPQDLIAVLGQDVGKDFSPVIALAATATIIALEVVRQAPEKPDGEIILHGGKEIVEDLANLAEKAGVHTYTQDELNQAMLHAVNLYRVTATAAGMVDEQALSEEFAQILNAQDKGDINKVLPGIERYDNGRKG